MARRGDIVGAVDFGSQQIRVLIARRDEQGIQVLGHGVQSGRGCISQGVIQNLGAAQEAFKHAVAAAEKEARIRVPALFAGVNGRNVETFISEGEVQLSREVVEPAHMEEARAAASQPVNAAGKRVLSSLSALEWYVDGMRVQNPVGIRGQSLKVRIHFARIPAVIEDNIVACVESQRREVEDLVFQPLAAAAGCLTPEDLELGAAVLDMGRATTGLAVFRDYRILDTQCFEWGGYQLTRDVAAGIQVSFDEADELIHEYGISSEFLALAMPLAEADDGLSLKARPDRSRIKLKTAVHGAPGVVARETLDTIIFERAQELHGKARDYLETKGLAKHLVRGIVLTGGGSALRNGVHLAEAVYRAPCRVGVPHALDVLPHGVQSPAFAACAGIARHGFQFRSASRNGYFDPRGPLFSHARRVATFVRKYFF